MAKGYFLVKGDKTSCGGVIIEGDANYCLLGEAVAREQDQVTCGVYSGVFIIVGAIPAKSINGRKFAGTQHSHSSCPCQATFIPARQQTSYDV